MAMGLKTIENLSSKLRKIASTDDTREDIVLDCAASRVHCKESAVLLREKERHHTAK